MAKVDGHKTGLGAQTRQEYENLLASFRRIGPNFSQVAKDTGWSWRPVKAVYEQGWPRRNWAKPIKDVLAEEEANARSAVVERMRLDRERQDADAMQARHAAIEVNKANETIKQLARDNVKAVLNMALGNTLAMSALTGKIRSELLEPVPGRFNPDGSPVMRVKDPSKINLPILECLRIQRLNTMITARAYEVAEKLINLDRVEQGKPTSIMGIAPLEMSAEAAAQELESQSEAIRLIQAEAQGKSRSLLTASNGEEVH